MEYNYIDLVLGGFLVYGAIKGLMKGLIVEIAGLLALVLGVWGAIHFSGVVGEFLSAKFDWNEKYISLSAFVITFLGIIIAVSTLGKALTSVASVIALGWLNKLFGAIFGLAKFAFILSVLLTILMQVNSKFDFMDKKVVKESILFEDVSKIAPAILPMLNDIDVQNWWDKAYEKAEDVVTKSV
jgi:membrane protein required for colicin V production